MVPTIIMCLKFTLLSISKLTVYFGNERWIDIVLLLDPYKRQTKQNSINTAKSHRRKHKKNMMDAKNHFPPRRS
jgi:hypothetical protein